jgi:uncharacterized membrane-anchored protein YhcB (DUF1043 family)
MNVSQILNNISREDKLKYIIILCISLYFFTTFINAGVNTVIGLTIGVVVVIFLYQQSSRDVDDFNKDMEYKLKSLYEDEKIPEYFIYDANMIELFDNISDYKDYNYSVYEKLLDRTNDFLAIKVDIVEKGVIQTDYDFETAYDIYINCMNYFRSFKHSLPPELYENHDMAEKKYQILLKRNLDEMLEKANNSQWNVYKKSLYYYDGANPSDLKSNDNSTFFGAY